MAGCLLVKGIHDGNEFQTYHYHYHSLSLPHTHTALYLIFVSVCVVWHVLVYRQLLKTWTAVCVNADFHMDGCITGAPSLGPKGSLTASTPPSHKAAEQLNESNVYPDYLHERPQLYVEVCCLMHSHIAYMLNTASALAFHFNLEMVYSQCVTLFQRPVQTHQRGIGMCHPCCVTVVAEL